MMPRIRVSLIYLYVLLALVLLFTSITLTGHTVQGRQRMEGERRIAARFLLSDLCLSTESRHTRHLSQPELLAAFQDLPGFHDHFPSSSFIRPQKLNWQGVVAQETLRRE